MASHNEDRHGLNIRANANLLRLPTACPKLWFMTTIRSHGRYGDALRSAEFRALLGAVSLSITGTSVTAVALTVLVYQRTSSPFLSALTFALGFLPYVLGGAFLSALVDRVAPRRLLVSCDLGCAVLVTAMVWPGLPTPALLALLVAIGTVTGLSSGARGAVVRGVVPDIAYVPARSLLRIAAQIAQIAGNAAGGALLVLFTSHEVILVNTLTFLGSATLMGFGLHARSVLPGAIQPTLVRDSLAGLRAVFRLPVLRRWLLLGWVVPTFAVAPEALAAPYVEGRGGSVALVGWWLVAVPVGMIAGDLIGVRFLSLARQRRSVAGLAAATFVPFLAFVTHPPIFVALALLVLAGLCASYSLGLDQRVRDAAPRTLFARTMAVNTAGLLTLQGVGFAIAGAVAQVVGPSLAIAFAGGCGLVTFALLRPQSK